MHGLDDFLFGTYPKPEAHISNPENSVINIRNQDLLAWKRLDLFLLSWLLSSISESMLGHVVQCQTSTEIWKVLDQLFATKSKARILQLRFQLQNTKKGAGSIEDYILKMKSITTGFENSAESGTTRPSRNRLEGVRNESDTGYGTITNSGLNQSNSDDSAEIPS